MLSGLPFKCVWFDNEEVSIYARIIGSGAPLILLHGWPQSGVMWNTVARELAKNYLLIIPDLPGYGKSIIKNTNSLYSYSFKSQSDNLIEFFHSLNIYRAAVIGHDRGARVADRINYDYPGFVVKCVLVDILPTAFMWENLYNDVLKFYPHWSYLTSEYPDETIDFITKDPDSFLRGVLPLTRITYDPEVYATYISEASSPEKVYNWINDYRASKYIDPIHVLYDDECSSIPILFLWSKIGVISLFDDPQGIWKKRYINITDISVEEGHFLIEENPSQFITTIYPFLTQW